MTLAPAASGGLPAAASSTDGFTTTILVNNIHCPSCVTHIGKVLGQLSIPASRISVSIMSQKVHVQDLPPEAALLLCAALTDAAFAVHNAYTVDKLGKVVSELDFPMAHDGWLDGPTGIWSPTQLKTRRSRTSSSIKERDANKKHRENCAACRAEEVQKEEEISRGTASEKKDGWVNTDKRRDQTLLSSSLEDMETEKPTSREASNGADGRVDGSEFDKPSEIKTSPFPKEHNLTLSIGGMTCSSCTNAIKDDVQGLDFVESVEVDLITNSARIRFRGQADKAALIVEAIEDIGYEAQIVTSEPVQSGTAKRKMKETGYKATLSISGMTCVSCTNAIIQGLRELPFVTDVNITLMSNSGEVSFRGTDNLDKILEKIDDLGYDSTVIESNAIDEGQGSDDPPTEATTRAIQLKIDGMFCEHCPPRITEALRNRFSDAIEITKAPSLKDPIISVTYQPAAPDFTIRSIISTIDSANDQFRTKVYHPPSIEDRSQAMRIHERRRVLRRLLLSFLVAIPTFLIGVVWMSLVPDTNPTRMYLHSPAWAGEVTRSDWALFILATPVFFFAADVFHVRAIKEIRALWRKGSKTPILQRFYRFGSMNLLISAGTSVAYVASLALLITGATSKGTTMDSGTYFDSVVFLTFFILIGRYLEAYSKSKTGDAVSMLGGLKPQEALLVTSSSRHADGESTMTQPTKAETINADLLEVGDFVIVSHGSSPPADGDIISGQAQFDESSLTGESRPVRKGPGETVFVGTVNTGNPITIRVTKTGGTSMLDQIVSVVREGQTKRAPVERVADILTGYFVPVITALAIITFFTWFAIGESGVLDSMYLHNQAGGWAFWSLEFAIAVFVVACPCGIGLAAPTALFVGGGLAAKHGILVRGGGEAFQEAGSLDAIVFDKTGTLTEGGSLSVTDHEILKEQGEEERDIWAIIKTLEEQSSHPIAAAMLKLASSQPSANATTDSIIEEPGRGVRGTIHIPSTSETDSRTYEAVLGNEAMISSLSPTPPSSTYFTTQTLSRWQSEAKSIAILAIRRVDTESPSPHPWTPTALFATADPLRPSALPTIQTLLARNLSVYMLSGDNPTTALAIASSLGIPATNVFAGVLPTEKAERIAWLQDHAPRRVRGSAWARRAGRWVGREREAGQRKAKVAFVGDGINDTPALHAADVSISVSTGSSIAMSSSSFILLTPSLLTVPLLLTLSRRVFRRIQLNFAWAVAYNALLVPVAAGVLFAVIGGGWRLGPVWASAAMAASSVSVVVSSLALRWEGGWRVWRRGGKREGEVERGE